MKVSRTDWKGKRCGLLTVDRRDPRHPQVVYCTCECGKADIRKNYYQIRRGVNASCGCAQVGRVARGQRFGMLTAAVANSVAFAPVDCDCDCGSGIPAAAVQGLLAGRTVDCGCRSSGGSMVQARVMSETVFLYGPGNVQASVRGVIDPRLELDVYVASAGFAIEVDGAHWHAGPDAVAREDRKDSLCAAAGIRLYRFRSDKLPSRPNSFAYNYRDPISKRDSLMRLFAQIARDTGNARVAAYATAGQLRGGDASEHKGAGSPARSAMVGKTYGILTVESVSDTPDCLDCVCQCKRRVTRQAGGLRDGVYPSCGDCPRPPRKRPRTENTAFVF